MVDAFAIVVRKMCCDQWSHEDDDGDDDKVLPYFNSQTYINKEFRNIE